MPLIDRVIQNCDCDTGTDWPDFEIWSERDQVDLATGEMVSTGFRWGDTFSLEPVHARVLAAALVKAADAAEADKP